MKKLMMLLMLLPSLNTKAVTVDSVWKEIKYHDLKHPDIVLAQSIKEAGWEYNSHNAIRRHNLFGLKGGKKSESNKYGYKIFNHWSESINDYKNRIQNRYIEGEDYYNFLIRIGYFQADSDEYINDLKWIIKELIRRSII